MKDEVWGYTTGENLRKEMIRFAVRSGELERNDNDIVKVVAKVDKFLKQKEDEKKRDRKEHN